MYARVWVSARAALKPRCLHPANISSLALLHLLLPPPRFAPQTQRKLSPPPTVQGRTEEVKWREKKAEEEDEKEAHLERMQKILLSF